MRIVGDVFRPLVGQQAVTRSEISRLVLWCYTAPCVVLVLKSRNRKSGSHGERNASARLCRAPLCVLFGILSSASPYTAIQCRSRSSTNHNGQSAGSGS